MLDAGVLAALKNLLAHYKNSIQKEAAWTVSNITAGNQAQIQAVIDEGIVPLITEMLISVS